MTKEEYIEYYKTLDYTTATADVERRTANGEKVTFAEINAIPYPTSEELSKLGITPEEINNNANADIRFGYETYQTSTFIGEALSVKSAETSQEKVQEEIKDYSVYSSQEQTLYDNEAKQIALRTLERSGYINEDTPESDKTKLVDELIKSTSADENGVPCGNSQDFIIADLGFAFTPSDISQFNDKALEIEMDKNGHDETAARETIAQKGGAVNYLRINNVYEVNRIKMNDNKFTQNIAEHEEDKAFDYANEQFNKGETNAFGDNGLLNSKLFTDRVENNLYSEFKISDDLTMTGKEILESKAELEAGMSQAQGMMGDMMSQVLGSLPPPFNQLGEMFTNLLNSQEMQNGEQLGVFNLLGNVDNSQDQKTDVISENAGLINDNNARA